MTHFSQAWTARQHGLDRIFAETIRLVPMRAGDRTVVMADATARIDQAKLEGQLPKVGDLVVAIDRPDAPSFEVTTVESDGLARILLSLVRLP
jgi:hypothetical protein